MVDILSAYLDMADQGVVCSGSDNHKQTQNMKIPSHDRHRDSMFTSWPSKASSGSRAMLSFGHVSGGHGSGGYSALQSFEQEETGDEYWDEYFNQPEKKRRLSVDQVQFLERSFEADNKLEPERKVQLAKELGLQPRQIAVWFQNRRARWKTRQLETDYESLHAKYTSLRTDYDTLLEENEKLKAEVLHLKHNGIARDSEKIDLKSGDMNGHFHARPKGTIVDAISDFVETSFDGAGDSSCSLRFDGSDLSQNRVDDLHVELLPFNYAFPKVDDTCGHPPATPFCNGFPVEDHAFSFWSC